MNKVVQTWVIGAGAIAEQYHLPAIKRVSGLNVCGLVDRNPERLQKVGDAFAIEQRMDDFRKVPLNECELVLICVPPVFQAPIAEHFLKHGKSVFIEKPGAVNAVEFQHLLKLSKSHQAPLMIGVFRRLYGVTHYLREIVRSKRFGDLRNIRFEEGYPYAWANESAYVFDAQVAGGGVLLDTGAHTLDRVLHVSGCERFSHLHYADNWKGGVESECSLRFIAHLREQDTPVQVEGKLSRLRELKNAFEFEFDRATLGCGANVPHELWIDWHVPEADSTGPERRDQILLNQNFTDQIEEYFYQQIIKLHQITVDNAWNETNAHSMLLNFQLFDHCYANRTPLNFAWQNIPEGLLR